MNDVTSFITALEARRNRPAGSTWIRQAQAAAAAGWTEDTHRQHERWREELLTFINDTPDSRSNTLDINIIALMEKMRTMRGWNYATTASRLKNTLGAVADLHNRPYSNTRAIKGYMRWLTRRDASQPRRKAIPLHIEDLARVSPELRGPLEAAFILCVRMGNATGVWMSGYDPSTHTLSYKWGEHKTTGYVPDLEQKVPILPQFPAAREWLQQRWERVRHRPDSVGRMFNDATIKALHKQLKRLGFTDHSTRRGGAQYRHHVLRQSAATIRLFTLHTSDEMLYKYLDVFVHAF